MPHPQLPGAGQTALITGASSGIGLDLAHILARHGYALVLVARSRATLEQLAANLTTTFGVPATPLTADLSTPGAPQALFNELTARDITIDILVNDAGFGAFGRFDGLDLQPQLDMIQVNVTALTALTRLFLPGMVSRGHGKIMNVASTAAFLPGPLMAVYYATKAYVLSFSQALAEELRDTAVTLTALCPGPTVTNFANVANMLNSRPFRTGLAMRSHDVAQQGYDGMMRGDRIVVTGMLNKLMTVGLRLIPRSLATKLARMAQENR